jgi:hypothetical protein
MIILLGRRFRIIKKNTTLGTVLTSKREIAKTEANSIPLTDICVISDS